MSEQQSNAQLGVVDWFNSAKGYGFIKTDGGDVFVHYSAITTSGYKTLNPGDEVEFLTIDGSRGRQQASQVKVTRHASSPKKDIKRK